MKGILSVGLSAVGLSAGTSTIGETIDEVHRALVWIGGRGGSSDVDAGECSLAAAAPTWEATRQP